jgi:hypothetical protein
LVTPARQAYPALSLEPASASCSGDDVTATAPDYPPAIAFHATQKATLDLVASRYPGFLHELSIDPKPWRARERLKKAGTIARSHGAGRHRLARRALRPGRYLAYVTARERNGRGHGPVRRRSACAVRRDVDT